MSISAFLFSLFLLFPLVSGASPQPARIGSKIFTEAYILAEILALKLESSGFPVERMTGLGATGVTEQAMKSKKIDLIVDYTGSIKRSFFGTKRKMSTAEIRSKLEELGFTISEPLGFNNTYTLAVRPEWAQRHQVSSFSDLRKLPTVRAVFTPEFTNRKENWPGLKAFYAFTHFSIQQLDHQLAYQAVKEKSADVVEAYSTDAKIKEYSLLTLKDDKGFFPNYDAVILTHLDWVRENPEAWKKLQELSGTISEKMMIELNSQADVEKRSFSDIASQFLGLQSQKSRWKSIVPELWRSTYEHLVLVFVPVLLAFLFGVPLAYLTYRNPRFYPLVGSTASIFQTIPALAFLTLLIPLFGIGTTPALIVLFLYALLPIFISSYQGFSTVNQLTHLSSQTLGLTGLFKFRKIEFPLALPSIFAGLQTSFITTVASATLAALIGAGGYGKKIIAGLAVNDMSIVLLGAVPAALMALFFQFIFFALNRSILKKVR